MLVPLMVSIKFEETIWLQNVLPPATPHRRAIAKCASSDPNKAVSDAVSRRFDLEPENIVSSRARLIVNQTAPHKTERGTVPDGSLKDVECDVSRRMNFKVFTARDPRIAPANCRTAVLDRTLCAHGVTRLQCPCRAMGFFRKCRRESAIPSGTDVDRLGRYVRKVPKD